MKEKLVLKNYTEYVKLVANAYNDAPDFDSSVVSYWESLKESNNTLFKRLLSNVEIIFSSEYNIEVEKHKGELTILGRKFKLVHHPNPYDTQQQMMDDFKNTGSIMISIDYSDHPIFTLEENVTFRTVHDYITHILGNHPFGARGEIAAYNRHAKLCTPKGLPALFTEVVGQACVNVIYGSFPKQKIALLKGFDYREVGVVSGYEVTNKELTKKESISTKKESILYLIDKIKEDLINIKEIGVKRIGR